MRTLQGTPRWAINKMALATGQATIGIQPLNGQSTDSAKKQQPKHISTQLQTNCVHLKLVWCCLAPSRNLKPTHTTVCMWQVIKKSQVPEGRIRLGSKWVFKIKKDRKHRSRLVCLNYTQIPGIDFVNNFSVVIHDIILRIVLSL